MADLTQFDIRSARRIARVVQAAEQEPRRARPLGFSPVLEQRPRGQGQDVVFKMCTFTGAWSKTAAKTVTFRDSTATVSAVNLFANIATAASARNCAIARDGTAWYLIAAEC
jgi:hypothetical protein